MFQSRGNLANMNQRQLSSAPSPPRVSEVKVVFPRGSYLKVIEEPNLTCEILEYFASDEVSYPANKTIEDLRSFFPGRSAACLSYHVLCAEEVGLLHAAITKKSSYGGVSLTIGYIDGLSPKGGDYVKQSKTKFWGQAVEKIRETGATVTTQLLSDMLIKLVRFSVVGNDG